MIRVVPPFTTANQPKITNGGSSVPAQPANFTYVYTSPSTGSATLTDPYLGSQTWTEGWNWGNKVLAGGEYVVAEARRDWTAIWYGGKKAWFSNRNGGFATAVGTPDVVTAKAGASSVPVYGRAYPEDGAYAGTGVPVQSRNNESLTKYGVLAGQKYALAGGAMKGSYYNSGNIDGSGEGSRTVVVGDTSYYPIRFNHRIGYVRTADVQLVKGTAPDPGTDRYNLLGRDASGVLWQYQGTGSASSPFFGRFRVGGGWDTYNAITTLTALRADGTGDMVARDKSGVLWYYKGSGNPSAPFERRTKVGGGWSVYDVITGARDITGDGKPDLIARDKSGGLWLYQGTGNASAPFRTKSAIGSGWNTYTALTDTGDLTGDGRPDLVARDKNGVLWLYKGKANAASPYERRTSIGSGWNTYNVLRGPSDLNRDGRPDLVGRDKNGVLYFYKGTGSASAPFERRTTIGTGWNT